MNYKLTSTALVAVAVSLIIPQVPAQAQGVFDMGALTNTMAQGAIVKSERERAARRHSSKRRTRTRRYGSTTRLSRLMLGTFTQSAAVRKRSIDTFLAKMRVIDPKNAPSLEKTLATQTPFTKVGQKLATYGLKTNNIADPMAVYLVVSWLGTRGKNDDPSKAQLLGVRNQMARAIADTPAVRSLTNAQKQEMADSFLLQAMIIDGSISVAKKQPSQMPQTKAAIATGARSTFGFDLNALNLTSNGLELEAISKVVAPELL